MDHAAHHNSTTVLDGLSGPIAQLKKRWSDYLRYRATLTELQALTDRELADMGLSRLSIFDVARESVYGE